jgi:BirA family biotin operon repressor/biotin-[acetyl-CoA-carboxylase] ligase
LAFSLILRPEPSEQPPSAATLAAWNQVGALATAEALEGVGPPPRVKWPNDVLLNGRKVGGVLLEVVWADQVVESLLLGVGLNVLAGSAPPATEVDFPATSVEEAVGSRPDREQLLVRIVERIGVHSQAQDPAAIVAAVNQRLAYRGQRVQVSTGERTDQGILERVGEEGEVVLSVEGGETLRLSGSDPHLRPVNAWPE